MCSKLTNEESNGNNFDKPKDFIRTKIENDLATGKNKGRLQTRFPPEPNGYLHLGHAKSICLNFGLASEFGGKCNLRFDDTNPVKENTEFVESIKKDVSWLGFSWNEPICFASDYFEKLYLFAEQLIKMGKAYVDSLSAEKIRQYRGTLIEPGTPSPYRERSIEENLDLFRRMKSGEFSDGAHVLRAKIDMASPNIVMRDPTLYRIRRVHHHRTGNDWCIYPMYDFTHCISDSIEKVTHSLCTLEFVNNRELYDWVLENLELFHSQQTEFARLNLSHTVLSKRKLRQLVEEHHVDGWDDPRMPTLTALRRRGVPPASIREFCSRIGVARAENMVEYGLLEFCIREELNRIAPRTMAVINPLKVIIENYPEGKEEWFDFPIVPDKPEEGVQKILFSREVWIEREDFLEEAPKKFFRLSVGKEVRLRCAYYITCTRVEKDEQGNITAVICQYDPETRGGGSPDGRKVKGTLHWVSCRQAYPAEIRLYDMLFLNSSPEEVPEGSTFLDGLNSESLRIVKGWVDPSMAKLELGKTVQFERLGYFCVDKDSTDTNLVFNRTATLKDTWAKVQKKEKS